MENSPIFPGKYYPKWWIFHGYVLVYRSVAVVFHQCFPTYLQKIRDNEALRSMVANKEVSMLGSWKGRKHPHDWWFLNPFGLGLENPPALNGLDSTCWELIGDQVFFINMMFSRKVPQHVANHVAAKINLLRDSLCKNDDVSSSYNDLMKKATSIRKVDSTFWVSDHRTRNSMFR